MLITCTLPNSKLALHVSEDILDEVQQKLVDRFGFSEPEVKRLISRIKRAANLVTPEIKLTVAPDDPDDNVILECAVEAHAHLIVSADHHHLKIGHYEGIGIAHPKELKRIFAGDYR